MASTMNVAAFQPVSLDELNIFSLIFCNYKKNNNNSEHDFCLPIIHNWNYIKKKHKTYHAYISQSVEKP